MPACRLLATWLMVLAPHVSASVRIWDNQGTHLAGVQALWGDEQLLCLAVLDWVVEGDLQEYDSPGQ